MNVGLVENFNGVLKMKLVKALVDSGYRVPGQTVDVVSPMEEVLLNENDAGIAMYNGISSFMAMHGTICTTSCTSASLLGQVKEISFLNFKSCASGQWYVCAPQLRS